MSDRLEIGTEREHAATDAQEWIVIACKAVLIADNYVRELEMRKKYAAGRYDPREVPVAQERLKKAIEHVRELLVASTKERR